MKKIFVLAAVTFFTLAASAQLSKDSLFKIIAKETCEEIAKKDLSGKNMDELQMELGLAMMPTILKYTEQLKSFGFDLEDQQSMMEMGKEVGMKLATDCPSFLKVFANNPGVLKEALAKDEPVSKTSTLSGTLIKIVPGDISYIQVRDASGKLQKIWWMEYFQGSDKLMNESAKYLNKTVKLGYTEKEIYNATLKDYVKVKVLTSFE